MRRYLNNYGTTLTASISDSDTTISVDDLPSALGSGQYYVATLADDLESPTKTEIIRITAVGDDLTVTRGQENTTPQAFDSGAFLEIRATAQAFQEIDGAEIRQYTETINAAAGATLDRSTGGIQRLSMTANTTLNLSSLTAGQSVFFHVTGGTTYTLSYIGLGAWSTGSVPTLKATHYLEFVHDGVEVVGFDCGGR